MIKIWGRKNSINVQKVLWCCHELDLEYERIDAGHHFGITDTPEYAAINPNRLVPTIEDGDIQLWESNVIVRYLAQRYGAGVLCPADISVRFDAERWMDWQATTFWPVLRPLFIALIRTPETERDPNVVAKGQTSSLAALRILDGILDERAFVAGREFTMGDIPVGATVHRWLSLAIDHPRLPNVDRWYGEICNRAAFREAVMTPLS